MNIRIRISENGLYRMINAAFLTCIALFGVGRYWGVTSPGLPHILSALAVILLLTFISYLSLRGRILCTTALLGCLFAAGAVFGFEKSIEFLASYGGWLLLVLLCYLLQMILERNSRIKEAGAVLLLAGLLYSLIAGKEQSHIGVAFTICYLVMILVEWTQRHWNKTKSKSFQTYMLWIMPFLAAYLLLLIWTPVPSEPYDWKFFKDLYRHVSEAVVTITRNIFQGGSEDYQSGLSGFSENGNLGEEFTEGNTHIMTLQGNGGLKTNVYLIGNVFNTFDGRQWQQLAEGISEERYIDTAETLSAVENYDEDYRTDYLFQATLKIRYQDFNSSYVFAPLKTISLERNEKNMDCEDLNGSLIFDKKKSYGTEYEATFYQMNMDEQSFYDFLEANIQSDDAILQRNLYNMNKSYKKDVTMEDVENYRQMINTDYLDKIPLSDEVEAYLAEITRYAETDVEKLRAIETELSSFTYTKTPGALPDSVTDSSTFLDYFLLESKQGYCSYFATSFVLLARAEGIPARFVQGYCVPTDGSKEVQVTSGMAHAWPEVYLENIGWIPFEPTPGYAQYRYTPWKTQRELEASSNTSGAYISGLIGSETDDEEEEETSDMDYLLTETDELIEYSVGISTAERLYIAAFIIAFAIVLALVVFLLDCLIRRIRYKRLDETQKYLVEIRKNFRILAWLGIRRRDDETLEELQKRITNMLSLQDGLKFLKAYEAFLYGNQKLTLEIIENTRLDQTSLVQILKQKKKWIYIYYRIYTIFSS